MSANTSKNWFCVVNNNDMAESTITKILLRRGPAEDLKLAANDTGALLDQGEPGFTTDTKRLYIGDGTDNVPVPRLDDDTLMYGDDGRIRISATSSAQLGTMHEGNACSAHAETGAAVVVPNGGIYVGKDVNCAGDVVSFCSSDQRLKDRIKLIDNPLERLNKIKGVTFEWNTLQDTYSGEDTGIIAQDIEQTELPGVVTTRDDGYKAVRYDRLIPLLVESVKQLNSRVEDLSRIVNRHGLQ